MKRTALVASVALALAPGVAQARARQPRTHRLRHELVAAVARWARSEHGTITGHHPWGRRPRQQVVVVELPVIVDGQYDYTDCTRYLVLAWQSPMMAAPWHGVAMKRVTPISLRIGGPGCQSGDRPHA